MTFCTLWCQIFPLIIRFCFLTKPSKIQVRMISYPKQNFNKCLVIELLLISVTSTSIFLLLLVCLQTMRNGYKPMKQILFWTGTTGTSLFNQECAWRTNDTRRCDRFWEKILRMHSTELNRLLRKLTEDL